MGRIEKTVFISYRRTNVPWALAIYQNLTMHGYDVFFDYESIPSGSFEKVILENIRTRAHFVVILTPSALERCKEPADWLRREIETAMDEKRNMVPLMLEGFDFGSTMAKEALTGKLASLHAYNGLRVYSEYFFPAMDKLREQFLNVEVSGVAHPELTMEVQEITEAQKTAAEEADPVEKEQLTAQEWFERGIVFANAKAWDEAIRCYSEAIRLEPEFFEAYGSRGIAYGMKGDPTTAVTNYNKALEFNPLDTKSYNNIGVALRHQKRYEEAEAAHRKAIELDGSNAKAYNNLGLALRDQKRYEEAEGAYRKAIELDGSNAGFYSNLGILLGMVKRYAEAEGMVGKAIEMDASEAGFYVNLGIILRDLQRYEEAQAAHGKAIDLNPSHNTVYHSYLAIASINKQLGKNFSSEHITKARQFMPKADWYDQACLESVCGNVDLAIEHLQRAAAGKEFDPDRAWTDPDLQWIRNDPRFEKIVGPRPE